MKKITKILIFLLTLIILASGVIFFIFSKVKTVEIDKSNEALGIEKIEKPKVVEEEKKVEKKGKNKGMIREDIINIALFGIDRRSEKEVSRSDSMMILTIDYKHKKIKLSSLMRDIYVPIENHRPQKLNHAYALGGPQLAIKTINQNFGTDIRNFATVDFFALEKIIDALGGIKVDVKEKEIRYINSCIDEVARIEKKEPEHIKESGEQLLNGIQAVAYSRIRYVGNGDFERTERQRKVLSIIIDTIQEKGVSKIPELVIATLPYIETSLSKGQILEMGFDYFKNQPLTLEQNRFPLDGYFKSDMSTGVWYLKTDLESTKAHIQEYIYENNKENEEEIVEE